MTFCTHCAAAIPAASATCPACGHLVGIGGAAISASRVSGGAAPRHGLLRTLYLAPFALVLAFGGAFVQREQEHQAWLASAYSAANEAESAGDLIAARDGFATLVGYRDAAARADELRAQLAPLEADYTDGVSALERGDFRAAVAILDPVAAEAPALRDVTSRLADAKRLLADQLNREVDAAQTMRDWTLAEKTLRELVSLDPADRSIRERLGTLQREQGPIVLGNGRALWLVSPDGSEQRQLLDSRQIIWPAWSPDRSQVSFLSPDSDDPAGNVALFVVGLDGGEPRRLAAGVSAHAAPVWSPDGSHIAYTSFAGYDPIYESGSIGVRVVDVASGAETDLTGDEFTLAFNPSWSPDGTQVAFIVKYQGMDERPQHSPGDVYVATLGAEGFENLTEGSVRHVWSVAWSPLGQHLLLFSLFGQTWYEPPSTSIRILDLASGDIEQIAGIDDEPTMPVWSPQGSKYAYTVEEKRIVVAGMDGSALGADAPEALSGELTWSPDGESLIVTPWNAEGSSTRVDLADGRLSTSPVDLEFDASPPFLSPPQWSAAAPVPPEQNPAVVVPRLDLAELP